jgi:hypothetical protein
MRNYETHIYDYVEKSTGIHVVKAVTLYEGKAVYAIAKCDPNDNFDLEFGKKLAIKRLDQKIAFKRAAHSKEFIRFCEKNLEFIEAERKRLRKVIEKAKVARLDRLVEANTCDKEINEMLDSRGENK